MDDPTGLISTTETASSSGESTSNAQATGPHVALRFSDGSVTTIGSDEIDLALRTLQVFLLLMLVLEYRGGNT